MEIKTEFNIGDKVEINPLMAKGRIISVRISSNGIELYVKYYYNNDVKYDYFFSDELVPQEEKVKAGFSI